MKRLTTTLVLVAAGMLSSQVAHAGHGFVPPLRFDVAPVIMATADKADTGVHVGFGLHWASLSPDPMTPIDIWIGYSIDSFVVERPPGTKGAGEPDAYVLHGPYIDIAQRISGTRNKRMFLGGRAELLYDSSLRRGYGVTVRAAWEVMAAVRGHSAVGTIGLGLFIESGYRKLPIGEYAFVGMAGLSLRLPFIAE